MIDLEDSLVKPSEPVVLINVALQRGSNRQKRFNKRF